MFDQKFHQQQQPIRASLDTGLWGDPEKDKYSKKSHSRSYFSLSKVTRRASTSRAQSLLCCFSRRRLYLRYIFMFGLLSLITALLFLHHRSGEHEHHSGETLFFREGVLSGAESMENMEASRWAPQDSDSDIKSTLSSAAALTFSNVQDGTTVHWYRTEQPLHQHGNMFFHTVLLGKQPSEEKSMKKKKSSPAKGDDAVIPANPIGAKKKSRVRKPMDICKEKDLLSKGDEILLALLGGVVDIVVLWAGVYDHTLDSARNSKQGWSEDRGSLLRALRSISTNVHWFRRVYIVHSAKVTLPVWLDKSHACIRLVEMPSALMNQEGIQWRIAARDAIPDLSDHFVMMDARYQWFGKGPVPLSVWFHAAGKTGEYLVHTSDKFRLAEVDSKQDGELLNDEEIQESIDVSTCAPGCSSTILGDGICDRACLNPECNADMGDCAVIFAGKTKEWMLESMDPNNPYEEASSWPQPHMIDIHPSRDGDQFLVNSRDCTWRGGAGGIWIDLSMMFPILPVSAMGASSWSLFSDYKLFQKERGVLLLFARAPGKARRRETRMNILSNKEEDTSLPLCSPALRGTVDLVFENTLFGVRRTVRLYVNQMELRREKLSTITPYTSVLATVPAKHPHWVINEKLGAMMVTHFFGRNFGQETLMTPLHCGSLKGHGIVKLIYETLPQVLEGRRDPDLFFEKVHDMLVRNRNSASLTCRSRLIEKGKIYVNWKQGETVTAHSSSRVKPSFSSVENRWAVPFQVHGKRCPTTELVDVDPRRGAYMFVKRKPLVQSKSLAGKFVSEKRLISYIYVNRVFAAQYSRFPGTFGDSKSRQRIAMNRGNINLYHPIKLNRESWGKRPIVANMPLLYNRRIAKHLATSVFKTEVENTEQLLLPSDQDFIMSMAYHHAILEASPEVKFETLSKIFSECDRDKDGILKPSTDLDCLIGFSPLIHARQKVLQLMDNIAQCLWEASMISSENDESSKHFAGFNLALMHNCSHAKPTLNLLYSHSQSKKGDSFTSPFISKIVSHAVANYNSKDKSEYVLTSGIYGAAITRTKAESDKFHCNGWYIVGDMGKVMKENIEEVNSSIFPNRGMFENTHTSTTDTTSPSNSSSDKN
eukprot:Nk52_evm39s2496 gene=Nk52_evmTU39s2496